MARSDGKELGSGELLDVSPGGCFVAPIGLTPAIGAQLWVTGSTSAGEPIRAPAVVRWTGMSRAHKCIGFGVSFLAGVPAVEALFSLAV
jgi:hypothetical protein